MSVYISRLEGRNMGLGPRLFKSPLLGYKRVQDGFEGALVGKEVTIGASQGLEGSQDRSECKQIAPNLWALYLGTRERDA